MEGSDNIVSMPGPSVLQLLGDKTGVQGEVKKEWLEGIIAMYS
jgi:hypothetical protein